jgi:hypothetical protein
MAEVTPPSPADDHHATPATRPLAIQDVDGRLVAVAPLDRRRR